MPPPTPFSREWMGTWEASEVLGIAARTIRRWVLAGKLRGAARFANIMFIPRSEIERVDKEIRERELQIERFPPKTRALIKRVRERSLRSLARSDLAEGAGVPLARSKRQDPLSAVF